MELYPHQLEAANDLRDGCILNGGVGSGKTLTSLYYYKHNHMKYRRLYVITTAKKRNSKDFENEAASLGILDNVTVDSWNNIGKYAHINHEFFIFDEHRAIGYGKWTKTFIDISRNNQWIMLTATPGDCWHDYVGVFIANGWFRNKTDFERKHVIWHPYTKYPKVQHYVDERKLMQMRDSILIDMDYKTPNKRHIEYVKVGFDDKAYDFIRKYRVSDSMRPITSASEYVHALRAVVNRSDGRKQALIVSLNEMKNTIIFYNFNYELFIIRDICASYFSHRPYGEYNGHKHDEVPDDDGFIYVVQYTAGAEGWNCPQADKMIFYSMSYSYKVMEQAMGRIDRVARNTRDIYYEIFLSEAPLDKAIRQTVERKKKFNELKYATEDGYRG